MVLGERIKAAREALGWSQPQLSEKSGVDIGTISALEVRRSVRSKFAPALAKALGIDLEDLLRDDGNPPKLNAPPTDKQSLSVAPPEITLAQALPVVLDALAGIPAMRWPGVQAMLAQAVGHPEMRDDLAAELLPLLRPATADNAAPAKRSNAA